MGPLAKSIALKFLSNPLILYHLGWRETLRQDLDERSSKLCPKVYNLLLREI
jgi:hypothetical protein